MYDIKGSRTMQQVIEGTDFKEIADKIKALQNPKGEVIQVVIDTIPERQEKDRVTEGTRTIKPKSSKWQKVAETFGKNNMPDDVFEHVQQCSKEFREDFCFKHDLID